MQRRRSSLTSEGLRRLPPAHSLPPHPYKDALLNELQRQRLLQRGWQSVDLMRTGESGKAEGALSSAGGLSLLVALVAGIVLGCLGVAVDACTKFVVSFRIGVCENFFWLGQQICCAYAVDGECDDYKPWGVFFGGGNTRHAPLLNFFFYVAFATMFACIAAFLCKTFSPFAAGGGIIEVKTIVSGELLPRYLGWWTFITKAIGVCLATGSSLVVGKEGPFVHLGSCVTDFAAGWFGIRDDNHRRELIAAGAAGGLAAAFGAPIGGVIFAIEEISGSYRYRTMMQSLLIGVFAVLVKKAVDMFHTGRIVEFSISYQHQWNWFEIPLFLFIGAFGGMIGALFNVCNRQWIAMRKARWAHWKVTEVFILVVISASTQYFIPYVKGDMLELLYNLYQDCSTQNEMCTDSDLRVMFWSIVAGSWKLVLAIVTVGACVPSGTLVPTLAIGALYGRAFGIFAQTMAQSSSFSFFGIFSACDGQSQCIIPGVYAIVGSAAVLCGVTRMTICLAVIMFELTGGLTYLVPVVFGILAAKFTGAQIFKTESCYDYGIEDNKLPILEHHVTFDEHKLVSEIYEKKHIIKLHQRETLRSLYHKVKLDKSKSGAAPTGYPVIVSEERPLFVGYIERSAVEHALATDVCEAEFNDSIRRDAGRPVWFGRARYPEEDPDHPSYTIDLSDKVYRPPITIDPTESVSQAVAMFQALGNARVMVCEEGMFKGLVTRVDLLAYVRSVQHHS